MDEAAAWQVVAELMAVVPSARLREVHSPSVIYDLLQVWLPMEGEQEGLISVNRIGSLTAHAEEMVQIAPEIWTERAAHPGGPRQLAAELLKNFPGTVSGRNRGPERLVCQIAAEVLLAKAFDIERWDVRSPWWFDYDDQVLIPALACSDPALSAAPPWEVWAVTRGEVVVAWLWRGWCVRANGERVDLVAARAGGAGLTELAAMVTKRSTHRRAPALPDPLTLPGHGWSTVNEQQTWSTRVQAMGPHLMLVTDNALLDNVVGRARFAYLTDGAVPSWCGHRLLLGWLHHLWLRDAATPDVDTLFLPGRANNVEWTAVVAAARDAVLTGPW